MAWTNKYRYLFNSTGVPCCTFIYVRQIFTWFHHSSGKMVLQNIKSSVFVWITVILYYLELTFILLLISLSDILNHSHPLVAYSSLYCIPRYEFLVLFIILTVHFLRKDFNICFWITFLVVFFFTLKCEVWRMMFMITLAYFSAISLQATAHFVIFLRIGLSELFFSHVVLIVILLILWFFRSCFVLFW